MKRICLIGYLHCHGGIQRNIVNIGNALSDSYEVVFINLESKLFIPYRYNSNIRVVTVGASNHLLEFIYLYRILKEIKPDVVIGFWLLNAIYVALLKPLFSYKCIYSERNDPTNPEYGNLLKCARYLFISSIDGFVFQHNAARNTFNEYVKNKSVIIPNCVIVNGYEKQKYSKNLCKFITVGRLHRQKNHKFLITEFKKVVNKYPEATLDIYGDGNLRSELSDLIKKNNLENNVYIHGATKAIYNIMMRSDAFVLTSLYEGQPNVLLEAMAIGVPSLSTNFSCGGVDEIIENGKNGIIVYDDDKLSETICWMIENPSLCNEMGKNAKIIKERLSEDIIIRMWKRYIESFI